MQVTAGVGQWGQGLRIHIKHQKIAPEALPQVPRPGHCPFSRAGLKRKRAGEGWRQQAAAVHGPAQWAASSAFGSGRNWVRIAPIKA